MRDRFTQIYETDEWRGGSGPGSFPLHTTGYRKFLEKFISRNRVESVVDFGCGDWQFSQLVDWGRAKYQGYDIVPSVVEKNQRLFGSATVNFDVFNGEFASLPSADLLLVKDVLQHWSNQSIARFLPTLARYRYALITNCVNPLGPTVPFDTEDGGFRYLDLRQAPFEVNADHVFSFTNAEKLWWKPWQNPEWRKFVLLVQRTGDAPARFAGMERQPA